MCTECDENTFSDSSSMFCEACAFGKSSRQGDVTCSSCSFVFIGSKHCDVAVLGMSVAGLILLIGIVVVCIFFRCRRKQATLRGNVGAQSARKKILSFSLSLYMYIYIHFPITTRSSQTHTHTLENKI
jgi:hypothetical protein